MEAIPSEQQYNPKLQKDDNPEQICHKIFATEIAALQRTLQALDMENIKRVAELWGGSAHRVCRYGGSLIVAKDAYHKFLKIGVHVCAVEDKDIQLMEASLLQQGMCCLRCPTRVITSTYCGRLK